MQPFKRTSGDYRGFSKENARQLGYCTNNRDTKWQGKTGSRSIPCHRTSGCSVGLLFRRFVDVLDNVNLSRAILRLKFESQLLFDRGEK